MAVLAGKLEARREDCAPVAGKSTLNEDHLSDRLASTASLASWSQCSAVFSNRSRLIRSVARAAIARHSADLRR
jgi:hypothetical protein